MAIALALLSGWIAFEVWLASRAGVWETSLVKDTTIWFFCSGLVLFLNFDNVWKDRRFFLRRAAGALLAFALLESLLDLFVLSLVVEILLQGLVFGLVLVGAASLMDERTKLVAKWTTLLTYLIGAGLLAGAVLALATGWSGVDKASFLLKAVLPVWLGLGLLPLVYGVALYALYELALMRSNWKSPTGSALRLGRCVALIMGLNVRARDVAAFAGPWPARLGAAASFGDARLVVKQYLAERRRLALGESEAPQTS